MSTSELIEEIRRVVGPDWSPWAESLDEILETAQEASSVVTTQIIERIN